MCTKEIKQMSKRYGCSKLDKNVTHDDTCK